MKLNLGAGSGWRKEGWTNLDLATKYDFNIKKLSPYENNSVKIIYSSHMIEHLPWSTVDLLLKDCARVLSSDGLFRLVIPDVDILNSILENNDRAALEKDNYFYYNVGMGKNYTVEECVFELFGYTTAGNSFINGTMHTAFFNFSIINIMLRAAGFTVIERKSFADSEIKELEETQYMNPETGIIRSTSGFDNPATKGMSLYLECKIA
tara:strand:+ start:736 stop:1359 length:624 start_codon:yes stop_codon:yes gene_type:complete